MLILRRFYNLYFRNFRPFFHLGKRVVFEPFSDLPAYAAPYISIEKNVYVSHSVWFNIPPEGINKEKPIIHIGEGTQIGRRCAFSGANSIYIGKHVMFAPNVFISDHLHNPGDKSQPIAFQGITEPGKIIIEDGCWLGHGCVVIANDASEIRLGKNSIVAANSLVTKSFPDFSTIIGAPARNVAKVLKR